MKEKGLPFIKRTILFQNSAGERITGELIKIRLSCQNNLAQLPQTIVADNDKDGSIAVNMPSDCGILYADIIAPSKFKQMSYTISNSTQAIKLESLDVAKGSLRVKIKDGQGNLVTGTNFSVKLMDSAGSQVSEKYSLNYGEAFFTDVTAGSYSVSVEDLDGDYGLASKSNVPVPVDDTAIVEVVVSKTVKATINVSVVDKATQQAIPNATVKLFDSSGRTLSEKNTGDQAEVVVFYLTDNKDYTIIASHDDYLYETASLQQVSNLDVKFELDRITAQNSGRVKVRVLDEDGLVVHNAKVKLRFLETEMLAPYPAKTTDRNGIASFVGVKEGSYYAYVEKYPAFGDNKPEGKEIDIREVTYFTVHLYIGNSMVQVRAEDEDGMPVHEAEAEFFAENGESLGKIPLPEGIGQYELKADKRAYVVVRHDNFMSVQTMPQQLWPNQTISFTAKMEPRLVLGDPKIEFEGIFNKSGKQVQQLDAGNRYFARFKLSVPEAGNFSQGGFHFRIGDERLLVNEPLVIKDVIAGDIKAPLKGTSFTPPIGYEKDSQNLTEGDAKWVNIWWSDLQPMNYYFGFEIRVKSQITPYTKLAMHYRAWAKDEAEDYVRVPYDSILGTAETTAEKQALYAKTLDLQFLEGSPSDCQEDFCYSGESILDEDRGLYIYEPYQMRAGAKHKLTFDILNNSERQYDSSELYITVDGLTITGYEIVNASGRETGAENIAGKKVEAIDLGEFTKGKSVSSRVSFSASSAGNAAIEVKVIADGRVVFQRNISAQVVSEREMQVSVDPETIPAYIANDLQVYIRENADGQHFDVDNALVRLTITHPDKTTEFYTSITNGFGKTSFNLPALQPNAKIVVEAEKPEYYAEPLVLFVDSNVLRFSPGKVNSNLDTRGVKEQVFTAEARNVIGIDLKIKNIALSGAFKGLLDRGTMANFAKQYIGMTIEGSQSAVREFFKTKLSANARELLLRNEKLLGEYVVTATNSDESITWDIIVPLQVRVAVGDLPDNAPCLIISREKWDASTLENSATIEFEVQNNCMAAGSFVELDNLQAMLEWQGDAIGTVELTLIEAETGSSNSEILRPGMWVQLFKTIQPDSIYYAMLTFTPKQGHLGETAKFTVDIDGQTTTSGGSAFVGSKPSKITSNIKVVNLQQCITYEGAENVVELRAGQNDGAFTVDSSDCGNTGVTIELCRQNPNCSGGAEGGIEVTPLSFTLRPDNPTKEILVSRRSIPGMYGINVEAKVAGTSFREVKNIDVLVEPESSNEFALDKYELSLKGIGAKDEVKLTNKALSETVSVDASACDWGTAEEEGMFDLAGAGMGAAIAALLGAKTAIEQASEATNAVNLARTTDLSNALEQARAANQATEAAKAASEAAKTASETAQNEAVKSANRAVQQAAAKAGSIPATCDAGTNTYLGNASSNTGAADTTASSSFISSIGSMIGSILSGVGKIGSGVFNTITGRETASANEAWQVSTSPMNSTKDLDNSIADTDSAISHVTDNRAELVKSRADAETMLAELNNAKIQLAGASASIDSSIGICTADCALEPAGPCCPHLGTAQAAKGEINAAIAAVDNAIAKTEAAKAEIAEAISSADSSLAELQSTQTLLQNAKTSMGKLGKTMAATEGASSFNKGKFFGILGTYAALGAIAGGLMGGVFGDDPCDQRVTANLMDYVINLKDDNLPLAVDKEGVTAEWKTDGAQVFGTYDSQEVGIEFNNVSVEPGKPTYATVTISATRHYHASPTTISRGDSGFGPFNVPDQRSETYTQKFHLKLNTKDISLEIPPLPEEEGCLMGTLVGRTGREALPKIKLNWSWDDQTGIAADECDYLNDEAVYCDATQFGIMVNKRLRALEQFLSANTPLPCPPNPAIESLEEIGEEYNAALDELGMVPFVPMDVDSCWMPRSTVLFDGKPALLYYVEANLDSITWTEEVPDLDSLRKLLHFKAYLIKDGYSGDFQRDFVEFYTTTSFYDPPEWFVGSGERYADLFSDQDIMRFRTRYAGDERLSSAGLYDVVLAVNYFNEDWQLFRLGLPDAKIVVDLHLIENPYPDSIFYNLPFNGNIGKESSNGRVGYGVNFENRKDNILITEYPGESIDTAAISGSTTISVIETDVETDIKKINASASNRGFLMNVAEGSGSVKEITFSPNYATPVLLQLSHGRDEEPFSAFYQLQETLTPVEVGTNLGFWTGSGECLDFTGIPVFEAFDFKADREATSSDRLSNWEFAYAVDWDKADYSGNVYLKTVFFTPTNGSYNLKALQPTELKFITPSSGSQQVVELEGIRGMQHNSRQGMDNAKSLQDLFDLVESRHVCVTNSGARTAFWWNPKTLYETAGPNTSIRDFEEGLVAGQSCIGYSS